MSTYNIEDFPAEPPPPGVNSHFVDPISRAQVVVIFSSICLALMWSIFAIRLYTKCSILRSFGWDDGASLVAVALTTVFTAAVIWEMNILGPHGWDVRAASITPQFSEISIAVTEIFFGPTIFFAKLSIFLLYLRTFGPSRWLKHLTYFGISVNLIVYAATTFSFGYLCIRRPWETWIQSQSSHRCLMTSRPLNYIQGIFGPVSDLFIFLLPLPVIWKLQMPFRRKMGVSAIFATGIFAIIASILGLYYRIKDAIGSDVFWDLPPALLVAVVEVSIGVICGCMPYLASFFRHHHLKLSLATSLRYLFTRNSNHSSRSKNNVPLRTFDRIDSSPPSNNIRVDTNILGSIQGNGKFMKSGNFDKELLQMSSANALSSQGQSTYHDTWE